MGLFGKIMFSARKVWVRVAARIGIRRTGILKLRKDVRSCEYEDVHVMWQILQRHEYELEYAKFRKRSSSTSWSCFRRASSGSSRAPVLWWGSRQSQGRSRGCRPASRRYFINSSPVDDTSCGAEGKTRRRRRLSRT